MIFFLFLANSEGWQRGAGPWGPFGVRAIALSQPDRFATGASNYRSASRSAPSSLCQRRIRSVLAASAMPRMRYNTQHDFTGQSKGVCHHGVRETRVRHRDSKPLRRSRSPGHLLPTGRRFHRAKHGRSGSGAHLTTIGVSILNRNGVW